MKGFLLLTALISLSLGSAIFWAYNKAHSPIGNSNKEIIFDLTRGMTVQQVINELERQDLIGDPLFLSYYSKFKKLGSQLKTGTYKISSQLSPLELFTLLSSGRSLGRMITFPEGYNIFEIAEIFEKESLMSQSDFFNFVKNPSEIKNLLNQELPSLEGYLFPSSYEITKETKGPQLISTMVKKFLQEYNKLSNEIETLNWDQNKVVTLASIIEKETGAPWERPLISSVFHNRLKKGMLLQTDPTVLYARALLNNKYVINITRKDLEREHPYNTYKIKGLPPGPIANPGFEALKAVFYPDQNSEYLFFVSQNDGTHIFSKTYEEHKKAVEVYQKNPASRKGRSWRELNINNQKTKRE